MGGRCVDWHLHYVGHGRGRPRQPARAARRPHRGARGLRSSRRSATAGRPRHGSTWRAVRSLQAGEPSGAGGSGSPVDLIATSTVTPRRGAVADGRADLGTDDRLAERASGGDRVDAGGVLLDRADDVRLVAFAEVDGDHVTDGDDAVDVLAVAELSAISSSTAAIRSSSRARRMRASTLAAWSATSPLLSCRVSARSGCALGAERLEAEGQDSGGVGIGRKGHGGGFRGRAEQRDDLQCPLQVIRKPVHSFGLDRGA